VLPQFINESNMRIDLSLNSYYHRISLNLWLKMWCSIIGAFITLSISVYIVINRNISVGLAGLILTYSVEAVNWMAFMIRIAANLETDMISVERLREFSELEAESEWQSTEEHKPPKEWPTNGCIEYYQYSTAYRTSVEPVLKNINLYIKGGEKVGIVGRTGSGKTSFTLSLFRILEPIEGKIIIDGKDITTIGLHDLRARLTIIPQDPILFADTLRTNLDPFGTHSDNQLWTALENSQLNDFVKALPERLDFKLSEGGNNLSAGQKQLVCLARALLKNSKVLVLDEATSACDLETDRIIQNTIKEKFSECTLLTIAHRLNTVIDYDRILVLDFGKIVENDSPQNLLSNKNSLFYSLAKEAKIV
jgi:ABC-type multidrug transport system fused ATPase/permease subunit